MKTRDRVVSFAFVTAVVAAIWYGGAALRGKEQPAIDGATDARPVAALDASGDAAADHLEPATVVDAAPVMDAQATPISGVCRTLQDATTRKLEEASKARPCTPAVDRTGFGCSTSSNGATWGLRVDDVVALEDADAGECATGWLLRLVHVAVDGSETFVVPGTPSKQRAHVFNMRAGVSAETLAFYDWNGDGEDEVVVSIPNGTDDRASVWTYASGDAGAAIAPYAPWRRHTG